MCTNLEYNIRLSKLWVQDEKGNEKYTVNQFYGDGLKNLAGRHLKVGTNPWSHSVQATPIPPNIGKYFNLAMHHK